MDKKEQALKEINAKLDEINKLYKECEKIADKADVVFGANMGPADDSYAQYYPKNYKVKPDTTEAWVAENYNWETVGGQWITSSMECS